MQAQVKIFCEIIVESNIDVLREVLKQIIISSSSKFFYPVTDRVYSFPGVFFTDSIRAWRRRGRQG